MNELIKIEERNGIETVNARELHGFLEIGRDFSSWIKQRIAKYEFISDIDFTVLKSIPRNGGTVIDYHITTDMAKELSMVENNDKGREARRYFIAIEKRAKQLTSTTVIDYKAMGAMIAGAVTAAMMPVIQQLQNMNNQPVQISQPKQDYFSLVAYCSLHKIKTNISELRKMGMDLRKMSLSAGKELRKIPDERYGEVNSYPVEILDEYFRV